MVFEIVPFFDELQKQMFECKSLTAFGLGGFLAFW